MRKEIENWWKQALNDLLKAKNLFNSKTPEEFNKMKKRVSIVSEALKTGIEIN